MSSTNTQRTGRATKDRGNKALIPQMPAKSATDGTKTSDGLVPKIQPTAEQLRIAQIINDANKSDDPDLKQKVEQIIELTGKSSDAVIVALHDCDNDAERAINMLLEGDQNEGEWELSGKKKKNRQGSTQKTPEVNGHDAIPENKEEREYGENVRKREPKQREGAPRYRGPPRMNRGNTGRNWRNKENEKNERNLQEVRRERSSEGRSRGIRRGRGRGGRSRTFQNRGLSNDGFPQSIDTWTNSTAEQADTGGSGDATMTVGNWSDFTATEDWSEEDWTETLTETKVFTPSTNAQSTSLTALDGPSSGAGQNLDLASLLHKASPSPDTTQTSLATNGVPQQSSQPTVLGSQPLSSQVSQLPVQQTQAPFDFNQFAKQAAESIKAAVGVGSSLSSQNAPSISATYHSTYMTENTSVQPHIQMARDLQQSVSSQNYGSGLSSSQPHVQLPRELQQQPVVSQTSFSGTTGSGQHHGQLSRDSQQPAVSQQQSQPTSASHSKPPTQQGLPPRPKSQRARLPPPSKIPESAVVMPDDAVTSLDVQFGALQFGTDSSPFDFTSETSYQDMGTSTATSNHILSHASSVQSSSSLSTTLSSSVSLSKESGFHVSSHGSSAADNSTGKELGQSSSLQTQKVSGQDAILLSSQSERNISSESTNYVNHRGGQSLDSSLGNTKSETTSLNSYSNSSHDANSSYPGPYASQKSTVLASSSHAPSTVNYTHPNSSLASVSSDLGNSQQQSKYGSSSQSQNSYVSGSSTYSIQQSGYSGSTTTAGSTYPSQTGYSSHTTSSYGSGSSSYGNHQGYTGASVISTQPGTLHSTSVTSSKLSGSLPHGVKESILDAQQTSAQSYESTMTTSSSGGLSATMASASASNHGSQNSVLGLVSTSSSTTTTSVLKNSLSATGKTVPNIPPGVPAMLGHQYIMGQAGLPFYGLQQPVYSYEDLQMLQSKLTTLGYYDMQFQAATSLTGRDPGLGSVAYTADGKYSRADTDASSVATSLPQGQTTTQTHGQAFLNPALPPGYGYYFAGGMMAGGIHHYAPPIFPVPPATNAHGGTTNTQFQKASAYGSHSYSSGGSDMSGAVYNKTHAQLAKSYDKPGFHTGTPPPFNLAGSQTPGHLGASSAPYPAQFIPVLAHGQHHSTLLHHHLQQDTSQTGGNPAAGQRGPQALGQQKGANKQNFSYWNSN